MSDNPSILSHVSLGTSDMVRAVAFYERVLTTLGVRIVERITLGDVSGDDEAFGPTDGAADRSMPVAVAFGRAYPEFWINSPLNREAACVGNGSHVGFVATSRAQVDAFHAAAVQAGAQDEGAPGERPHYGAPYYGCFVHDLDGHKIEATFWNESTSA